MNQRDAHYLSVTNLFLCFVSMATALDWEVVLLFQGIAIKDLSIVLFLTISLQNRRKGLHLDQSLIKFQAWTKQRVHDPKTCHN